ncbi:hypothetical protein [Rhodohalobacter sp. 614A]|uniref:hypothetical protein n=1 Tax=Rhodohalobacter sp. 614A TaxID=2908649 RepID=UPI001F2C7950|nr:hypothetical protein [Rhodohalobacter sp. 614A]
MYSSPSRSWSLLLLILLIAIDLILIGFGIRISMGFAGDPRFALAAERGYAELYQYAKFLWIAIMLSWFGFEKRKVLYFVGSLLFFYFLLDDSLTLHESVGHSISEFFNLQQAFDLRGQDFGELIVSVTVGTFFLVSGWLAYRHSDLLAQTIGFYILLGVILLAAFGVGVDILHNLLAGHFPWTNMPLGILEDGGELIAASIISWFVHSAGSQELSGLQISSPLQALNRFPGRN